MEQDGDQVNAQAMGQHLLQPAYPQAPAMPDFLMELGAGSGGLLGLGFALYKSISARKKEEQWRDVAMKMKDEPDPKKCQDMLIDHPKIKV